MKVLPEIWLHTHARYLFRKDLKVIGAEITFLQEGTRRLYFTDRHRKSSRQRKPFSNNQFMVKNKLIEEVKM
jgi:hypothetical protein